MSEIYEKDQELNFSEEGFESEMNEEVKSEGGKGLGLLLVGGVLALGGLAAAGIKAIKDKKSDKPEKQKTRLKLVRVPVEETEEGAHAELGDEDYDEGEADK